MVSGVNATDNESLAPGVARRSATEPRTKECWLTQLLPRCPHLSDSPFELAMQFHVSLGYDNSQEESKRNAGNQKEPPHSLTVKQDEESEENAYSTNTAHNDRNDAHQVVAGLSFAPFVCDFGESTAVSTKRPLGNFHGVRPPARPCLRVPPIAAM